MAAIQSCAWCKQPVHTREDLDTDEKTVCEDCFKRLTDEIMEDKERVNLELSSTTEAL